MEKKIENFTSDIHTVDYTRAYEPFRTGAQSLIKISGRKTESLDGDWHFGVDWYSTLIRAHWYKAPLAAPDGRPLPVDFDFLAWPPIPVPSCWNMEKKELTYFEGCGLYVKEFDYIPEKKEKLFLHFEGASYRTYVFLNGKEMAMHDGGSTPFSVEITAEAKAHNILIVAVDGARRADRVPNENTDWFNYAGLYRSVFLIRTPEVFIKDWFASYEGGKINIEGNLNGTYQGNVTFSIPELSITKEIAVSGIAFASTITASPVLWSPNAPKRYLVTLSCGSDSVSEMMGFRTLRVNERAVILNGKEIRLKGISVHEDHPTLGKCTNDEVIRATIKDAKALGCNYLRLAHYPHSRRFAEIAEEEGLMLWEEVPVYWAIDFENRKTYQDAENQLEELILRDRNRASVIIWSVGNENADTDARYTFMSSLAKKAKALDRSRLVSAACLVNTARMCIQDRLAENLDVIGLNEYMGWYDPEFDHLRQILENSHPGKPVILTEFGGGARAGFIGKDGILFSEENQKCLYKRQFAIMKQCPFIAGTSPWILYDFRCPRRINRYQEGYNRKGLIADDRKTHKLAFEVLKEAYKEG